MKFILVFALFISSLVADINGGPYVGISYGISQFNDDGYYQDIKEDKSKSAGFYAGAYINKHLSVEFAYVSFDAKDFGDGFSVVDNLATEKTVSFSVMSLSTSAHYAFFNDTLDFYAKFGAGEMHKSYLNEEGFTMLYGIGSAYRFNEYLSVKIAYDSYHFGYDEDYDKTTDYRMKLDYVYTAVEFQF